MESPVAPFIPLPAATRFALILDGLMKAIAARIVEYPWTGAMILYVWTRVTKTNQRFQRLAALILAGKLPRERFTWPRPPRTKVPPPREPEAPVTPAKSRVWRLFSQERFAWLRGAMPSRPFLFGAAAFAGQLQCLLDDPEMRALLAATPRMGKLLRPLFWMLGLELARPRARAARAPAIAKKIAAEPATAAAKKPMWRRPHRAPVPPQWRLEAPSQRGPTLAPPREQTRLAPLGATWPAHLGATWPAHLGATTPAPLGATTPAPLGATTPAPLGATFAWRSDPAPLGSFLIPG